MLVPIFIMLFSMIAIGTGTLLVAIGLLAARPDDLVCPACGQHLRGIASEACPECGRAIDAPRTRRQNVLRRIAAFQHRHRRRITDGGLGLMLVLPVGMAVVVAMQLDDTPPTRALLITYGIHAEGVRTLALAMPPTRETWTGALPLVTDDDDPDALEVGLRVTCDDGRTVDRKVDTITTADDLRRWFDDLGLTPSLDVLHERGAVGDGAWEPDRFSRIVTEHARLAHARRHGILGPVVGTPGMSREADTDALRGAFILASSGRPAGLLPLLAFAVAAALAAFTWVKMRRHLREAIERREREEIEARGTG